MNALLAELGGMSLPARCVTIGAAAGAAAGAILGLIIGLLVHAQTAWFAVFEAGIPAGLLGGFIGLTAAALLAAGRRLRRGRAPSA